MALPAVPTSEAGSALHAQGCPFRGRCAQATELCATVDPELRETPRGGAAACHYVPGL
jgi:ABC-type dipeptide/oligopeptide/nickel transport system ATPase component